MNNIKRGLDFFLALVGVCLFSPLLLLIPIFGYLTSGPPVLHWSNRIGKNNKIFRMPKFRTMKLATPDVASHLLDNPEKWLTPLGGFMRKYSIDELPQLWSILLGHMSFVGPRPALHSQFDLISARSLVGVDRLTPGLTGWAQINGRDDLTVQEKLRFDTEYLHRRSIRFDLLIMWLTVLRVVNRSGISH